MIQILPKSLTFDEFVAEYGDHPRYQLIDGELVDMEPTGSHEQVTGFINMQLNLAIAHLKQPYFIPMRCLIKP
ncbi:MAG: Uma2 family endonuclease [Coleofasciculus sp. A1-SPW-01]|uniref:hypothetical protein n=1 Tax=Coleofasciculus sp. A1-SPW-01 TaxID=3070819 RepID=UPI003303694B